MADFLLEIGLEEIPARMVAAAEAELAQRVEKLLGGASLLESDYAIRSFSTPRRLAVLVSGVRTKQSDSQENLTGPSWKVAFQNGEPTAAALAFAKKAGVEISALKKIETPKGDYVGVTAERKGETACDLLSALLPAEIAALYWPKSMYWRRDKPERFVRPVRWLVAMLDGQVVPITYAGISAGNSSRGHRVMHGEGPVVIERPTDYVATLRGAYVVVDAAERRHTIRKELDRVTRGVAGARWREDWELIETVVSLTEWPGVLMGSFEPEYLALPEEILVTVMRDHQKYFAVEGSDGKLIEHFLTVLNIEVDDQGRAIIRHGNERVLRSRFKDAQFFWNTDQKIPLTERVEMLKAVTFQKDLGSYFRKTEANLAIAGKLVEIVSTRGKVVDRTALMQAVLLAKTDLTAELVKEFTELQGIVGGLYARAQGLGETVASAIYAQYSPASMEDAIPTSIEGQLLGIADRVQTIGAMFGIGNAPTGSKDPFALRRAANGVVKILAESELPLTLNEVVALADGSGESVGVFLRERLNFYLKDVRGFAYDVVAAVLGAGANDVRDAVARCEALTAVRGSRDFLAVSAAFKRIQNILGQAAEKQEFPTADYAGALVAAEERDLASASAHLAGQVAELRARHQYQPALELIATLGPTVDAFFDKVMVMTPDMALRGARLGLIRSVLESISGIADFSEIVVSSSAG